MLSASPLPEPMHIYDDARSVSFDGLYMLIVLFLIILKLIYDTIKTIDTWMFQSLAVPYIAPRSSKNKGNRTTFEDGNPRDYILQQWKISPFISSVPEIKSHIGPNMRKAVAHQSGRDSMKMSQLPSHSLPVLRKSTRQHILGRNRHLL
jgi:hypothetical protein